MTVLRIASFNSWKGDGDYPRRLAAMARGFAPLRLDVLAVQECLQAEALGFDTAEFLAKSLGFQSVVAPLRRKPRAIGGVWADSASGLALLSPWPLRDARVVPLPSDPRDGERAALIATLDWRGQAITVACVHLTHLPESAGLRQAQLTATQAALGEVGPRLIAGDFNAPVEDLAEAMGPFEDARAALGSPAESTLVEDPAAGCIDHVWATPPLRPLSWRRALETPALAASDHCAVVTEWRLEG